MIPVIRDGYGAGTKRRGVAAMATANEVPCEVTLQAIGFVSALETNPCWELAPKQYYENKYNPVTGLVWRLALLGTCCIELTWDLILGPVPTK
jgi:hypothetical protein